MIMIIMILMINYYINSNNNIVKLAMINITSKISIRKTPVILMFTIRIE